MVKKLTLEELAEMPTDEAVEYVLNNDLSYLLADAEVMTETRSAPVVTSRRADIEGQANR